MSSTAHLIEKEWLENKVVTTVPFIMFICSVLIAGAMLTNSGHFANFSYQYSFTGSQTFTSMSGFSFSLTSLLIVIAGIISIALSSTYFPKTLLKERQEGSWMFWRSMPVSDLHRHLVKLLFGLIVIPFFCSLFVLATELLFWAVKLISDNQVGFLLAPLTFVHVIVSWTEFLGRMLVVALAMLPLAAIALAVSQKTRSPIITLFIAIYLMKLMPILLFGYYGVSHFVSTVIDLPSNALFDSNPFSGFMQANMLFIVIYFALGIAGFLVSLKLSQTME